MDSLQRHSRFIAKFWFLICTEQLAGPCPCARRLPTPQPTRHGPLRETQGMWLRCHPGIRGNVKTSSPVAQRWRVCLPMQETWAQSLVPEGPGRSRKVPQATEQLTPHVRAQFCPILCDPVDGSPPGSSVHGILQARILEWVATSYSISYI